MTVRSSAVERARKSCVTSSTSQLMTSQAKMDHGLVAQVTINKLPCLDRCDVINSLGSNWNYLTFIFNQSESFIYQYCSWCFWRRDVAFCDTTDDVIRCTWQLQFQRSYKKSILIFAKNKLIVDTFDCRLLSNEVWLPTTTLLLKCFNYI